MISGETGLLPAEDNVMDHLVDAAEGFARLPVQHPSDADEFMVAIHHCQDLLALRVARRTYPKGWRNQEGAV